MHIDPITRELLIDLGFPIDIPEWIHYHAPRGRKFTGQSGASVFKLSSTYPTIGIRPAKNEHDIGVTPRIVFDTTDAALPVKPLIVEINSDWTAKARAWLANAKEKADSLRRQREEHVAAGEALKTAIATATAEIEAAAGGPIPEIHYQSPFHLVPGTARVEFVEVVVKVFGDTPAEIGEKIKLLRSLKGKGPEEQKAALGAAIGGAS